MRSAGWPVASTLPLAYLPPAWSQSRVLTWFLAPAHLVARRARLGWRWSPSLAADAVRGRTRGQSSRPSGRRPAARVLLLLAVLAVRGPGGYWFVFWTEPGLRTAYVVVSFVLFGWVLACLVWALARPQLGRRRAVAVALATLGLDPGRRSGRCSPVVVGLEDCADRTGTTSWRCCRGGCRGSSGSPPSWASRPSCRPTSRALAERSWPSRSSSDSPGRARLSGRAARGRRRAPVARRSSTGPLPRAHRRRRG